MERKKVLGFWDLMLFTFCAMFGVEAIPASAAIGPSAISWWLICTVGFFIPFGLIAAELGSTYPQQGGIYVWVKRGLGEKWAARTTWYYWFCLPVWLPALYIAVAEILGHVFFPQAGLKFKIFLAIIMIWATAGINLCSLKFSKWVPNIGAVTRFLVVAGMVAAAAVHFFKNSAFANQISFSSILPNLDSAVVFIPMIVYNLLGFELMSGAAGEMKNPGRDIPKTIICSAFIIVSFYLLTTFTIWVVMPASEINVASGILQIFITVLSDHSMRQMFIIIAGLLLSVSLFSEIVTWTLGDNRTVAEAARDGRLPKVLGKINEKNSAPTGAAIASGIISTAVILIYGFIAADAEELFWHTISFSTVVNLFSYLILFPTFIVLRKKDKAVQRPYRLPGPDWVAIGAAIMAEAFVLVTVLVLLFQPGSDSLRACLPIIIGVLITIVTGEILVTRSAKACALGNKCDTKNRL
jgi:amino acid transporter